MLTYGGREMKTFQIINSGWGLDDNILLTFKCLVMVIIHLVIGIPYSDTVRILRGYGIPLGKWGSMRYHIEEILILCTQNSHWNEDGEGRAHQMQDIEPN